MKFSRVNKKHNCQICGSYDWCGFSSDGKFAVCMREASDKPSKNGGWTHVLIEDDKPVRRIAPAPIKNPITTASVKRSAGELDAIYREFLGLLDLTNDHHFELKARGLDLTDIHLHGYKSIPAIEDENKNNIVNQILMRSICRNLASRFNLQHVPGFYFKNNAWHFVDYFNATGYLVPIRNAEHKIVALQLRRDDDRKPKYMLISSADKPRGASSGAPPHFAYLGIPGAHGSFKEIIVTEGALKANIIAAYSDTPTVGLVGVGCFDETFPLKLKEAFPNLAEVSIAFDMDAYTNDAVLKQRKRLQMTLEKINLKVSILSWNRLYKGFDDFLVNNTGQKRIAA